MCVYCCIILNYCDVIKLWTENFDFFLNIFYVFDNYIIEFKIAGAVRTKNCSVHEEIGFQLLKKAVLGEGELTTTWDRPYLKE